ncbi:unnamed protein product [Adineta ricciae]|uniref:SAM domain-containing protein n=1 Tax=Adineta ricciae TaxID=249248 RepID=A0A814L476_ADIRI|nr:unnamed protein product [Adineta ricciae]CAF1058213.1 unnamed protein product [Adineta ricciae]
MNNEHNTGQTIKPVRRLRVTSRRMKSTTVRDVAGSISTFKRFYQSGGRDYEQYRLWLQTLVKSNPLATPSNASVQVDNIKEEPMDMKSNVVSILPPVIPSAHSQQRVSVPKISYVQSECNSQRLLSLPINATLTHASISSFEPKIQVTREHLATSMAMNSSTSSLNNWSVSDVSRFIEKHFPDKNIARKFVQQKIDGRTLPLLTEDHLIRVFKMKLGPALHLLSLIATLRMQN